LGLRIRRYAAQDLNRLFRPSRRDEEMVVKEGGHRVHADPSRSQVRRDRRQEAGGVQG
jgi:hypothetical protein